MNKDDMAKLMEVLGELKCKILALNYSEIKDEFYNVERVVELKISFPFSRS